MKTGSQTISLGLLVNQTQQQLPSFRTSYKQCIDFRFTRPIISDKKIYFLLRQGKFLVFRVQGTGHYVPVEVRTGVESAGRTEILAGLNLGDSIVVSGQFLLDSEANINNLAIQPLPHQRESTASDQARHPPATVPGASTMEGM